MGDEPVELQTGRVLLAVGDDDLPSVRYGRNSPAMQNAWAAQRTSWELQMHCYLAAIEAHMHLLCWQPCR